MSRPPTMDDVARAAGVSRALVSLVMRGSPKVSDLRRRAVLDAAEELGYRPNVLARNLASHRTRTLGVMVNDLRNPYFADVIEAIERTATPAGYRLLMTSGWMAADGEAKAIETFLEFRTDGIVLAGPRLDERHIVGAAQAVPLVAVGRAVDAPDLDTVNNDEGVGARLVVDHLTGLGHRRIAHLDGGGGAGAADRRAGYAESMTAAGLSEEVNIVSGDFTEESGALATRRCLETGPPPTAIFAANDLMAAGVLSELRHAGLDVPGDVSVVGYDNTALAATDHLSLTTVNQPRGLMGQMAFDALLERIEGRRSEARHEVLAPELVVRATVAPPR